MSEETNSPIGQTVGDYKVVKLLGEGGMGEVYAAQHLQLGHRSAVKVLRREIMNNKEAVERFRQEARLIARVRHQNLIDIFDIGELSDGRLYYVMEYLSGQSLSSLLEKKRLSFREVMQIMRQLCAGLSAAHKAGIVHRENYIISIVCFHVGHDWPQRRRNTPCTLTVTKRSALGIV
jgi:serine/threonine-protein kinase